MSTNQNLSKHQKAILLEYRKGKDILTPEEQRAIALLVPYGGQKVKEEK